MRAIIGTTLLVFIALSGCLNGSTSDTDGTVQGSTAVDFEATAEESPTDAPEPVETTPHGDPVIQEGEPESSMEGLAWVITQTITIDNGVGDLSASDILADIPRESIHFTPSSDGSYHYTLILSAHGASEAEAQTAFDSIEWSHDDAAIDGVLHLTTKVEGALQTSFSCSSINGVSVCNGASWSAQLVAQVPPMENHDIALDAGSGDIFVADLRGAALSVDTGSGDAVLDSLRFRSISRDAGSGDTAFVNVAAQSLTANAGSGDIDFDGGLVESLATETGSGDVSVRSRIHSFSHSSGSGDLDASLVPTKDGSISVGTGSGDVDIGLSDHSSIGYDLLVNTGSGDIDVSLPDMESIEVDEDRVHMRTIGFDRKDIRTSLDIETGSGDVEVAA